MAQRRVITATVELVVEGEPGDDQSLDRVRELVGQELQLDRKNSGIAIRALRGESVTEVLDD